MRQTRDREFERVVALLIDAWMGPGREIDGKARIAAILASDAGGDPRVPLANDLIATVVEDFSRVPGRRAEERLEVATELHDRAVGLRAPALVAFSDARRLMWEGIARPENNELVVDELEDLVAKDDPDRPAVQRVWAYHGLAAVLAYSGSYEQALSAGVIAAELARQSGLDIIESETSITLSFIFLSVGDIEGAQPVVEAGIAAGERAGWRQPGLYYNALLSYLLSGRYQAALEMFEANPWLADHADDWGGVLSALRAAIYAGSGQVELALQLIDGIQELGTEPWANRNRVWMIAQVLLQAGRSDEALRRLEEFLSGNDAGNLTPLNATQTHLALSEAREATGDPVGALKALRSSHDSCFNWVAESVISRLQAIELSSEIGADHAVLERRSDLVRRAAMPLDPERASVATDHLAHLTHDMRNSLQGVMAMISMLQLSDLDDKQHEYASIADASAKTLLALCNDVLDLARIDAGKFDINPVEVAVRDLIDEVVSPVAAMCEPRDVAMSVAVDASVPDLVVLDPLRFKQVLLNLVSNAAKFTTQGSIAVEVTRPETDASGPMLRVVVTDTGPGIADRDVDSLFDEFARPSDSVARGSGLGLAVTKKLVELMGGSIDFSTAIGAGSRFGFMLPVPDPLSPAALSTGS